MIRVALVEDNAEDQLIFKDVFSRFCRERQIQYELDVFSDCKGFLDNFKCQYDLIYMDIELPDGNGLETSKRIRKMDSRVLLVFLTNLAQFAINGYEVDALDFNLKPLNPDIFALKMKKVLRYLERNKKSGVNLILDKGKKVVNSQNLVYVEVQRHTLIYHLADEVYEEKGVLKDVEESLKEMPFGRPNYCYIVNLKCVSQVLKYDLFLTNGECLQISRNRKKEFMEQFSKYLGGTL